MPQGDRLGEHERQCFPLSSRALTDKYSQGTKKALAIDGGYSERPRAVDAAASCPTSGDREIQLWHASTTLREFASRDRVCDSKERQVHPREDAHCPIAVQP